MSETEKTLEDLRAKIIQSMGGKPSGAGTGTGAGTGSGTGESRMERDKGGRSDMSRQDHGRSTRYSNERRGNYQNAAQYNNNMSRDDYYQTQRYSRNAQRNPNHQYGGYRQTQNHGQNPNHNQNYRYQNQPQQYTNQNQRNRYNNGNPQPNSVHKPPHHQTKKVANLDDPIFRNITKNRAACHIVIEIDGKQDIEKIITLQKLLLTKIEQLLESQDFLKDFFLKPVSFHDIEELESKAVLHLETSEPEQASLIIACHKFLVSQLNEQQTITITRPQNYIATNDRINKICNKDTLCVENVETGGSTKQEILANLKAPKSGDFDFMEPIFYKDSDNDDIKFTKLILVLLKNSGSESTIDWKLNGQSVETYKINDNRGLFQPIEELQFDTLPKLATSEGRKPNETIILLNCIDPMELKEKKNIAELKESLKEILNFENYDLQVAIPSVDYRINIDHIKELAGTVFIKFQNEGDATSALNELSGKKFNGRTILGTYAMQSDIETPGLHIE